MGIDTGGISCCFDQESQRMLRDYRKSGLGETSLAIVDALAKDGLGGSTILEIGCGFGALALELIRRGASSAIGIDLSPTMVRLAQSLSAEGGLSGRTSFELGDGATAKLKKSDVVILDAVLCCYPDVTSLVDNSASAAGRYYAFAVPDDARLLTRLMRLVLPLQGVFFRRGGFKFYIHPTARIRSRLEGRGLRLVSKSSAGWIWSVFVFRVPGAP